MLPLLFFALLAIPIFLQWSQQLRRVRRGHPRPLDIGVVFGWLGFLYGGLPIAGFILAGWGLGEIQEGRIGYEVPEEGQIVRVGLMYLMFNAGFALAYALLRRQAKVSQPMQLARANTTDVFIAVGLFLLAKATLVGMRLALGVESSDDYLESYTALSGQPLIVQQLAGILSASELALTILVIVAVIAHKPRLHTYVAGFVALQIVAALVIGGSRTQAFACALAYLVTRSVYDPRLRFRTIAIAGGLALAMFLVAGALRQLRMDSEAVSGLALLQGGEFMSVFSNSLDLQERLADLESPILTAGIYLVDLLRFIPRQFIGDFKVDPATFYVTTFYPEASEAGAGLAFGAIAESTVGFGPPEALMRGLLLGLAYAWLRNACLTRSVTVVRAFIYVWFLVLAYQGIRDTTFSVFPRFFFQVLPILIALWGLGAFRLRRRRKSRRRRRVHGKTTTPHTMDGYAAAPQN